jgi:hypothetical protein
MNYNLFEIHVGVPILCNIYHALAHLRMTPGNVIKHIRKLFCLQHSVTSNSLTLYGHCQRSVQSGVRSCTEQPKYRRKSYPYNEMVEMLLVFGESYNNDKEAARLYTLLHPDRRLPMAITFRRTERKLRRTGRLKERKHK